MQQLQIIGSNARRFGRAVLLACVASFVVPTASQATQIIELLEPTGGGNFSGTFLITPSTETWAFGVGNDSIQDTSISGVRFIDGLRARDHWVSSIITRNEWENIGKDFDSIRPIGASPPSSFSIDTTAVPWQWGGANQVAFYWLSEAGDDAGNPLAVLQDGTEYDPFRFFGGAASPFAAFSAPDGGTIVTGTTIEQIVPEPSTALLLTVGLLAGVARKRRA